MEAHFLFLIIILSILVNADENCVFTSVAGEYRYDFSSLRLSEGAYESEILIPNSKKLEIEKYHRANIKMNFCTDFGVESSQCIQEDYILHTFIDVIDTSADPTKCEGALAAWEQDASFEVINDETVVFHFDNGKSDLCDGSLNTDVYVHCADNGQVNDPPLTINFAKSGKNVCGADIHFWAPQACRDDTLSRATDVCTFTTNGYEYNFKDLRKGGGGYFKEIPFNGESVRVSFDLCGNLDIACYSDEVFADQHNLDTKVCDSLGQWSDSIQFQEIEDGEMEGVQLIFNNGHSDDCEDPIETTLMLYCPQESDQDIENLEGTFTYDQDGANPCKRKITLTTAKACKSNARSLHTIGKLNTSWVFVMVVLLVFSSYCIFGSIYRKVAKKSCGVPNSDFWSELPGLVKDGCACFFGICKRNSAESSYEDAGYEKM